MRFSWPLEGAQKVYYIDLLHSSTFQRLSANPSRLEQEIASYLQLSKRETPLIIIDEIQMSPILLNEVHRLIELNKSLRFILTGSSARKLRRKGTNLLAGRAWLTHLHPLCFPEWHSSQSISYEKICNIGSLPSILDSPDPWKI